MEHLKKISWHQYCRELEILHLGRVANSRVLVMQQKLKREWTQRDTAKLVGRSIGKVNEDLRLAEGLRIWPNLEKCKTRAEALVKLMQKISEREKRDLEMRLEAEQAMREAREYKPAPDPLQDLMD